MPSGSNLCELSLAPSSSCGPSAHSLLLSTGTGSRPSPYASDHQHWVIHLRSRSEARQVRAGQHGHKSSLAEDDKATITWASNDFLATSCLSHVWECHCESRSNKAHEALVIANRKAVEDGRDPTAISTYIKGKVSCYFIHMFIKVRIVFI